jgi:hypothetical protein
MLAEVGRERPPIKPPGWAGQLGRVDAASLLWRLWLHGADIGRRASALADATEATLASGTNKVMLQSAELGVMFGVIAFARHQYPSAVELLRCWPMPPR